MTLDVSKMGLDDGKEIQKIMSRYYPLLLEQAAGDAEDALGVDVSFDMSNPKVQDVLDELAAKVKGVADTTRQDIRDLVSQQADQGWSIDDLAKAIRDKGVTDSKSRSEAIARTESATAYTKGSILAYQESGVVDSLEWLVSDDPCPICQGLDGQTVKLGDLFDGDFDGPPAHPNCTCAAAPIVKGA